jgi:peptide-methionine (R)-S-oxide reductase
MKYMKLTFFALLLFVGCDSKSQTATSSSTVTNSSLKVMNLPSTDEEWKKKLTPEEYHVLREKGTDRPFVGKYDEFWEPGVYVCKGCGTELFTSKTKFDAGCGWPAFYEGIDKSRIVEVVDNSFGMRRIEVNCAVCGGHLGHVFEDGPAPTGLRYCINSSSLGFQKKEVAKK